MLMSCGPWKPVYLQTFYTRIAELSFEASVAAGLGSATISATVEVAGAGAGSEEVVFVLTAPDSGRTETVRAEAKGGRAEAEFHVARPELWYPHGYGAQPLYTLTAVLVSGSDSASKRLGLRRARLVQQPLAGTDGLSFFFELNNVPLWIGGSNWIPADSFVTRLGAEQYRRWLQLAKRGRQTMVRYAGADGLCWGNAC